MPSWKSLIKLTAVRRKKKKKKYLAAQKAATQQRASAVRVVEPPAAHEVAVTTDVHHELTKQYAREQKREQTSFPSAPVSMLQSEVASSEEGTTDMEVVIKALKSPLKKEMGSTEEVVDAGSEDAAAEDMVVHIVAPVAVQPPVVPAVSAAVASPVSVSPVAARAADDNAELVVMSALEPAAETMSDVELGHTEADVEPRITNLEKIVSRVVDSNNSLIKEFRALQQVSPRDAETKAVLPQPVFHAPTLQTEGRLQKRRVFQRKARSKRRERDMVLARQQKTLELEMENNIREQMRRSAVKAQPIRKYAAVDIKLPGRKIVGGRVPIFERMQHQRRQREERLQDMRRLRDLEQGITRPAPVSPKKVPLTPSRTSGRVRDVQILRLRQ